MSEHILTCVSCGRHNFFSDNDILDMLSTGLYNGEFYMCNTCKSIDIMKDISKNDEKDKETSCCLIWYNEKDLF